MKLPRRLEKKDTKQSIPSNSVWKPCREGREPHHVPSKRGNGRDSHRASEILGRTKDIDAQASRLTEEGAGLTSHVIWTQLYPRNTLSVLFYLSIHLYTQE